MSYIIQIGSRADTGGIDKAAGALKRADAAADDFVAAIKAGVGIDIGGKIVNSLAAIPGMLQNAVSRGMEFNMNMDNARVGISNVLAKFLDLDEQAAKREAAKAIAQIVELEPKAAGGLEDLVMGFMATASSALGVGMSVQQNIDLVGKFANALSNAGRPIQQLGQEMRSIMMGQITSDSDIAKTLGITNEGVAKAKEAGELYPFLIEKLGKFGEAGDSAAVRLSSLNSSISKTLGYITEPIFDVWMESMKALTDAAGEDTSSLRELGSEIAKLVKSGTSLTAWLTQHPALLATAAKAVGVLVAAWIAFKIGDIVAGLALKTRALLANAAALATETAALRVNTAAQAQNAGARGSGVPTTGGQAGKPGTKVIPAVNASLILAAIAGEAISMAGDRIIPSFAAGGKSSKEDIAGANEMRSANAERITQLAEEIKIAKTTEDRDTLMQAMSKEVVAAVGAQRNPSALEETTSGGRTLRNEALSDHAAALRRLIEVLSQKGSSLLSPEAAKIALEEEKKKAQSKQNLEDNQPIMDADKAKRAESERSKFAASAISDARAAVDAERMDYAKSILDAAEKYQSDQLAGVKVDPATMNKEELKSALDMRSDIEGYLDEIKQAREELAKAIADQEKEAQEEAKKEDIKALQEQLALVEAKGQKALADAETIGATEVEQVKKRKEIEDGIAAKRLAILDKIGEKEGESATAREARQVQFDTEAKVRENSLSEAVREASPSKETKAGELFAGTRRRRGVSTSDAFEENVPIGESLLDHYRANQARAVGAINGRSILPADPLSSLRPEPGAEDPTKSGAKNGAADIKAAADAISKDNAEINDMAARLAAAGDNLSGEGLAAMKKAIASLTAKVEALAKNI